MPRKEPIQQVTGRVLLPGTRAAARYTARELAEGLAPLSPEMLVLERQPIAELPPLPASLTYLALSNLAELRSIDAVAGCPRLRTLILGFLDALDLPRAFTVLAELPELTHLAVTAMTLPREVVRLASLMDINLHFVRELEPSLAWLGQVAPLRVVRITDYRPELGSTSFAPLQQITELRGHLHGPLPPSFGELRSVEVMQLSTQEYVTLPVMRELPLVELDLGTAKLSTLPDWIGELQSLRVLNLAQSTLTRLPASLGRLAELRTLKLPCDLVECPDEIYALSLDEVTGKKELVDRFTLRTPEIPDLEVLRISDLTRIPSGFGHPRELILELPELDRPLHQLADATRLHAVTIEVNALEHVLPYLNAPLLKRLELRSMARTLPAELARLTSLEELTIHAPLAALPAFAPFEHLRSLSLHDLEVPELSPITDVPSLVTLRIEDCRGDVACLAELPALAQLELEGISDLDLAPLLIRLADRAAEQSIDLSLVSCELRDNRLPGEIGRLVGLRRLSLIRCALVELPHLATCTALEEVRFTNNYVPNNFRKCLPKGAWTKSERGGTWIYRR